MGAEIDARKRDPAASAISLTRETVSALAAHDWPGNVRELRNVMERACLLARGSTINLEDALVSEASPSLGIRTDLPNVYPRGVNTASRPISAAVWQKPS